MMSAMAASWGVFHVDNNQQNIAIERARTEREELRLVQKGLLIDLEHIKKALGRIEEILKR